MISCIFLYNFGFSLSGLSIALILMLLILGMGMIYNKLFKRPIIIININTKEEWSKERHFKGEDASDPNQDFNEVHTYFNMIWNFEMILKNTSRANAYHIKFLQLNDFKFLQLTKGSNNEILVVEPNQKVIIPMAFDKTYRVQRRDKNKYFTIYPKGYNKLTILIEFKSKKNKTFYRRYFFNNDLTVKSPISKSELDHWDYI